MPRGKVKRVQVLVGTRKGAFVFTSDLRRRSWKVDGPHFAGQNVYHFISDGREDGPVLFAAVNNAWFGSDIHRSHDGGRSWKPTRGGLRFEEDSGLSTKCIWHVRPGRSGEAGVLYAGVDPAGLFKSEDGGESWAEVKGLNRHPTRSRWTPGAGGLIVHTILLDPTNKQRMYVAISAAGVFLATMAAQAGSPATRIPGRISCPISCLTSGNAFTSWRWLLEGRNGFTSRITAVFTGARMAPMGKTSPRVCPRDLVFRSPSIRATQTRLG